MIEPSVTYGNLYLDITREYATQFKSGAYSTLTAASSVPLAAPAQPIPTAELKPNQHETTDILHMRAGPGINYSILGRLGEGIVIDVVGRSEDSAWIQIVYPSGDARGWVSTEFISPQTGLDDFPIVFSILNPFHRFLRLQ